MTTRKKMKSQLPEEEATADQISELPEEIIHDIFRRLDSHKSAARTSILSRRWLSLWSSYRIVKFDEHWDNTKFKSFAVATSNRLLLHQRESPLLLDSFTLRLGDWKNRKVLRDLLSSASLSLTDDDDSSRSPLEVVVRNDAYPSGFPEGGMFLNCRRTRSLYLRGFDLIGLRETCLDNLQELHLQQVRLCEQSFQSCLANAPRLEKLSLVFIDGIRSLDISASNFPSLKSLFLRLRNERDRDFLRSRNERDPGELMQLQITSAPLLQTLSLRGSCKLPTVVSSSSAPNLKSAELRPRGEIWGRAVGELISKLPSLESLELNVRHIISNEGVRISTHQLQKLTIIQWDPKIWFAIDAPNLVTLSIETSELPINLNVVNVAPTCQCEVHCVPSGSSSATSCLIELSQCLEELATRFHQLVFKLDFDQFKKYISEQIESENLRNCCSDDFQCWRHQFKDAEITSVTVDDFSTIDESMISRPSINMIFSFNEI
ncbi:F-box/LRR-repeat protein 25 [Linum perenne]